MPDLQNDGLIANHTDGLAEMRDLVHSVRLNEDEEVPQDFLAGRGWDGQNTDLNDIFVHLLSQDEFLALRANGVE